MRKRFKNKYKYKDIILATDLEKFLKEEKALTKFKRNVMLQHLVSSPSYYVVNIINGIHWENSPEGHNYWELLHNKYNKWTDQYKTEPFRLFRQQGVYDTATDMQY